MCGDRGSTPGSIRPWRLLYSLHCVVGEDLLAFPRFSSERLPDILMNGQRKRLAFTILPLICWMTSVSLNVQIRRTTMIGSMTLGQSVFGSLHRCANDCPSRLIKRGEHWRKLRQAALQMHQSHSSSRTPQFGKLLWISPT